MEKENINYVGELTNIYCVYDDNRCLKDNCECDLGFLKKFLMIYVKVYLKNISTNEINVSCYKCNQFEINNDIISNGIGWFQQEKNLHIKQNNENAVKINTLYLYIGNGFIKNCSDRCIVIMYSDDITKKMCYYIINKSRFILLNENENKKHTIDISNILKVCLNELFYKKEAFNLS